VVLTKGACHVTRGIMVHCTEIATRLHKTATTMPLSLQQEIRREISIEITEITAHKSTPYRTYKCMIDFFAKLFTKNNIIKQLLVSLGTPNTRTPSLCGSALGFLGPEPVLGVSRRFIRTKLNQWLITQHWAIWGDLGHTQRQARELISGPCPGFKAKFLSFNRTQSRAVTGLLTGHNTLRRHLYLLGLIDSPLCRGCRVKEETSAHILCECEALASLRHMHLGSFFLEPEDIKSMSLGAIWSFGRATGLL